MSVLNLQCSASNHDGYEFVSSGLNVISWNYLGFGNWYSTKDVALYFSGVSGLSGSTVTAATLTFRASESDSGSFTGDWYAEDGAAPGVLTTGAYSISTRTRTTATCEGDSADFGPWTTGQDKTFTGDGANTIANILQELADDYDPSAIVLIHIFVSGTSERVCNSFDGDSGTAPKLDITLEAAGGVEVTPSALAYGWVIPTPTFSPQTATFTPDAVAYGWSIPTPVIVAGVLIEPSAVAYGWNIPTPTWSGITTYTPDALTYGWVIPTPSVVAGVSITPAVLAYGWTIPTPTFSPQVATFTPTVVTLGWNIPTPTVSIGEIVYSIWYEITRTIDTSDFPSAAQYYLEVVLETSSAAVPAYARLWNVTDDAEVGGSETTTSSTDPALVRSGALTMSGSKSYRVEYGGEPGSEITMYAANVVIETN